MELAEALTEWAKAVPSMASAIELFQIDNRYTIGWNPSCEGIFVILEKDGLLHVVGMHFFKRPTKPQMTKLFREAAAAARQKGDCETVVAEITQACAWCRDNLDLLERVSGSYDDAALGTTLSIVDETKEVALGARTRQMKVYARTETHAPYTQLPGLGRPR